MSGGLLLVGAHVGDMDFTAGHLALLHAKAGVDVTFLHLTAGEGGHPRRERTVYRAQKVSEAEEAAGRFGARFRILDYADGDLVASDEVATSVASVINAERPAVIVTHWRGSFHRDHANCYFAVERALELQGKNGGAQNGSPQLFYAENWEDADGFRPDVVVDISDVFDEWLAGARCHELFRGGVVNFDYQGYYEALTTLRGKMSGVRRGAAFMRPPSLFFAPVPKLGGVGS
jgi:N-acetylglucosamine malate deacetylase 1